MGFIQSTFRIGCVGAGSWDFCVFWIWALGISGLGLDTIFTCELIIYLFMNLCLFSDRDIIGDSRPRKPGRTWPRWETGPDNQQKTDLKRLSRAWKRSDPPRVIV